MFMIRYLFDEETEKILTFMFFPNIKNEYRVLYNGENYDKGKAAYFDDFNEGKTVKIKDEWR